jgi:hypothetical protein
MEHNNIIETIGSITKMEILESLQQDILPESLVLKNILPFPGYKYENLNLRKNQESIFILLRYQYPSEQINKIFKSLIAERVVRYYPSYGEIITAGSINPCIRLKGLENYALIPFIQQYFLRNNLQLMMYKNIEGYASIKIFKSFRILKISEGLYRDANDIEKIYIRIPFSLNWGQFDSITQKIKQNLDKANFDGALGAIYRFYGTEDVIRIYDKEITLEEAKQLKKLYMKEINGENFIVSQYLQFD